MPSDAQHALDSIDRFILVGRDISKISALRKPELQAAAEDLFHITQKLLVANENMTRWLNRFLYFDFRGADARQRFLKLVEDYQSTKAGPALRDMKFSCGDIFDIYQRNVADKIVELFPQDKRAANEARQAFWDLGNADDDMVAFIYDTVVGDIDNFVRNAGFHIDRSMPNSAETTRLQFKVSSAKLTERLERFGGELSDLVLQYARLAHRPVTLI